MLKISFDSLGDDSTPGIMYALGTLGSHAPSVLLCPVVGAKEEGSGC